MSQSVDGRWTWKTTLIISAQPCRKPKEVPPEKTNKHCRPTKELSPFTGVPQNLEKNMFIHLMTVTRTGRSPPSRPSPDAGNFGSENSAGIPAIQEVNCCIREEERGRYSRTFRTYLWNQIGRKRQSSDNTPESEFCLKSFS